MRESSKPVFQHQNINQRKCELSIYYQNVRGLRTKTHTFYNNIISENYDIIALTETWLNNTFFDSELFDNRYSIIRYDRSSGKLRGGGVLLAIKRCFSYEIIDTHILCQSEHVIIKIKCKKKSFYIGLVYFCPNDNFENYENFLQIFEQFIFENDDNSNIVILGDFNLPFLYETNCDKNLLLREYMCLYNFQQHNIIKNSINRLLDLVFSDLEDIVIERSKLPIVPEDPYHPALYLTFSVVKDDVRVNKFSMAYSYDYSRGNYTLLYHLLINCDWASVLNCTDIDSSVRAFYDLLYDCFDQSIPKYKNKSISNAPKYPRWFSIELVRNVRHKNKLHSLIRKGQASIDQREEYVILRQLIKDQTKLEHENHIKSLEINFKNDPSAFWSYIKSKNQSSGIPTNMLLDGQTFVDSQGIANAFAKYFSSVYDAGHDCYVEESGYDWGNFKFSLITRDIVIDSINCLKSKKSTGPDSIPACIFKGCKESLADPLAYIFNLSLENCCFPASFKECLVSPVFKGGVKNDVKNYRPICLLNVLSKIFETIIYNNIYEHVNASLSVYQHGFMPDKSTVSNLLVFSHDVSRAISDKKQLDVIYTDCTKAFDRVNHKILLKKLIDLNFSEQAYKFIKSYLLDRSQVIKVAGSKSLGVPVTSGVPQGSKLGPLLFLIFINDLPNVLRNSKGLLYADDFKLYKTISSREDCVSLQDDLNSVVEWFDINKMKINIVKCNSMSFTRKLNYFLQDYSIENVPIKNVDTVLDLGVIFQQNLKFNSHFENIVSKAYQVLGFIIRNSKNFEISTVIKLYNSLVRPKLEYASSVWFPIAMTNQNQIEKVQKRFLRYLYVRKYNVYPFRISYQSMLDSFNVQTLVFRRRIQAIILIYNIINYNKYQHCDLIRHISFNVPKIGLRIIDRGLFWIDLNNNLSPLFNMQIIVNEFLNLYSEIDMFHSSLKQIIVLLKS